VSTTSFIDRVGVLRPLRHRDFRLLWTGQTVSMIGDGVYVFAVAWLVYKVLGASPFAFSLVGFAWTFPQVLLLLGTGALSDRMDKRHLMIAGDLLRLFAIAAIGGLIIADLITVRVLVLLVLAYGAGQAIFWPAFSSIVPMIVPEGQLVEANSIGQVVRPLCMIVIGPLIGALLVHLFGTGYAFLFDGLTFVISAACIALMRAAQTRSAEKPSELFDDIREGIRYVRATPWIRWGLLGGLVSLFCVWGPWETLVPFVVSDQLHGTELDLALVFGAGGFGSVLVAVTLAQRGTLPPKPLTLMYLMWAVGMGLTGGFGLITTVWQAMIVSFFAEGAIGVLIVIWFTLMQRLVPQDLLGRVSSLDWMISIMGAPISFLVVGPLATLFGADAVLVVSGALGAGATIVFMLLPGARDPERDGSLTEARTAPT
jgi:MFS family permease